MDCKGRTDSEEGESSSVDWQGNGHSFLGFPWIIFVDYLEERKTITGEYYAGLLQRLEIMEIMNKRLYLIKKKILFQDNALAHELAVAIVKLYELKYELIPHSPYSPDLAPCDFFLFLNFKKWLSGKKFSSDVKVINVVNGY